MKATWDRGTIKNGSKWVYRKVKKLPTIREPSTNGSILVYDPRKEVEQVARKGVKKAVNGVMTCYDPFKQM